MNAINQISSILTAMGAKPEPVTRPDGETVIKVNAPIINGIDNAKSKKYLTSITSPRGVCVYIAYYADTPCKNYRVYYCGSDTGERYEKIGNAARRLKRYAHDWKKYGNVENIVETYTAADEIPRRGSNA